jgi:hypothetical protein
LIKKELSKQKESFSDIISITLTENELNQEFDDDYGLLEGIPFTAWTTNRVYFPVDFNGAEWVGSVSRNPNGIPTKHIGDGGNA